MSSDNPLKASALRTIEIELSAVEGLLARIDDEFEKACQLILNCHGRVVVIGMGKSGHIGKKIAATLASTGTPAIYVHPADDCVLALSNSGTTEEVLSLLPIFKRKGIPLVSLTGNSNSELAQSANFNLNAQVNEEACPLGLAPTSSTTAALVLGDALAMALLEARGFTRDDFAISHPGGNLGRRLLVKVRDLMHSGEAIPQVSADTKLASALLEMSEKGFGLTTVTDGDKNLVGVFTDGDLRRAIDSGKDIQQINITEAMSADFKFINANSLAAEAARIMQESNVYVLIVRDDNGEIEGILKMHDLLQANVV